MVKLVLVLAAVLALGACASRPDEVRSEFEEKRIFTTQQSNDAIREAGEATCNDLRDTGWKGGALDLYTTAPVGRLGVPQQQNGEAALILMEAYCPELGEAALQSL